MKKYLLDLRVVDVEHINEKYVLIRLTDDKPLPEMIPGQFVEVRVDGSTTTFLRRPISIHYVDYEANELWLLVAAIGDGTKKLAQLKTGDMLNVLLPLGNGFTVRSQKLGVRNSQAPTPHSSLLTSNSTPSSLLTTLLIGGGVGVAPLLYAGKVIKENGGKPVFILGARSAKDLLELSRFSAIGDVYLTTEDGTAPAGYETVTEKGFVTMHSVWNNYSKDDDAFISVCGPKPMMVAVAKLAREKEIPCEVSLENMMACGLGACLCCVENTKDGNVCVCKEGPVFNIEKLNW